MATLQAYLDWHVRLNTVRRCLVERDCEVQSVQSRSTRSRRFLAYQQQQHQRQQLSLSDDGGPHAAMVAVSVEAPAPATETAAIMDAAVVVLKDWWRATHRPDLPQHQFGIPETETGGVYYPPHHRHQDHAANGHDKNGAVENQRSALEQRAASNDAN
jgi:hypothetical protein